MTTDSDMFDDAGGHDHDPIIDEASIGDRGAMWILRRGIRESPELRRGLWFTVLLALASATGRLAIPILIQQVMDRAIIGSDEFQGEIVAVASLAAVVVIAVVAVLSRAAYIRLVTAAEAMLYNLRLRAFAHIHALSLAEHNESKRGELTARVTSDIEIIARFAQWAGIAWIVNSIVIAGTIMVMFVYSWQLTLITIAAFVPVFPIFRHFQRRQLAAYDGVRRRVGETMSEVSEAVMGAAVIRSYGVGARSQKRLGHAIDNQYRAEMGAARYFALMFPVSDLFGGLALTAVVAAGAWYGPGWGLGVGTVLAFIFLVNLILSPVAELGEILDQTQQGIAGWRRVFDLLDQPLDVVEPGDGVELPVEPLPVQVRDLEFSYRTGGPVLHDLSVSIAAGANVAVVGETGSGKTTFAKLLCRFADPTGGVVEIGGVALPTVSQKSRVHSIRMVPQDGFLFDTTIAENVRYGHDGSDRRDVVAAFERLGLRDWVEALPDGIDTVVGERGENLSVGERQLVALARAQLADPGLLILDEATSAVDPETERSLSEALRRLSEGRTLVSVAHRLSTAEQSDQVLVFEAGRLVEQGHHDELVAAGGRYAALYDSWLGNTQR